MTPIVYNQRIIGKWRRIEREKMPFVMKAWYLPLITAEPELLTMYPRKLADGSWAWETDKDTFAKLTTSNLVERVVPAIPAAYAPGCDMEFRSEGDAVP